MVSEPSNASLADVISANVARVRDRLAQAADRVGRDPSTIRLVAISKTFPASRIRAGVAAGLTEFGESRVQEALTKISAMDETGGLGIAWHLIGHLQSNKARKAAAVFAWIHSVDRLDLLSRLDQAADDLGTRPNCLLQIDLAGELTKHGAPVDQARQILEAAGNCSAVRVRGLMVIPPWSKDSEQARPFFRRLRQVRDELVEDGHDPEMLSELSMGMSNDFEVAIEEGSTLVRVGTAIFGRRGI